MAEVNRQVILARNPTGQFSGEDFELREGAVPEPGEGQFLVRNLYLSLDPAMRIWAAPMHGYEPPVPPGEVMRGFTVSEVVTSRHPDFAPGDIVQGTDGWQDYAVSDGVNHNDRGLVDTRNLQAAQAAGLPVSTGLSVLGTTGLTGYYGILHVGKPAAGDTVLISGAAGAVGSVAGQVAKLQGCRVVGTAGSDEKCELAREAFGYDSVINYKEQDLVQAVGEHCPDGVDVYFDNVGGDALDAALAHLTYGARVVLCGAISQYNNLEQGVRGPANYAALLMQRATMQGFIVLDHYADLRPHMEADLIEWLQAGKLTYREELVEGLENAAGAINRLYDGRNMGKLLVRIADPA